MEWTNEHVLEFIELLQGEPVIWNHKSKNHKNRNLVNDAWTRINKAFSVPFTIEELKKKRNSLLTQYRDNIRKIKESSKSGSGADEIYRPTWFAFDLMNSFLGGVYQYQPTVNTEENAYLNIKRPLSRESNAINAKQSSESEEIRPLSRESNSQSANESLQSISSPSRSYGKRRRAMPDLVVVKMQMDEALSPIKERSVQKKNNMVVDESDLYAQLLARKLKKLEDEDRLRLMLDIDNLTFKYIMEAKTRNRPSSSISSPLSTEVQSGSKRSPSPATTP